MLQRVKQNGAFLFGAGLSLGLCVAIGMVVGSMMSKPAAESVPQFPAELLHAAGSDGSNTMAISTGHIADGVEGLFVLDFITGELQCSVLNPRTGGLGGLFKHNVTGDLGVQQGKQPRYLMVTGVADFRVQGSNIRPAGCVVYVADANTGRYAAYSLPWNRQAAQYNAGQINTMARLYTGAIRNVALE